MNRKKYKSLVGEYRALCALNYRLEKENKENRASNAIFKRIAELNETLNFPAVNRSYIHRSLNSWDVLQFGHSEALVVGSRNRMAGHPTPKLKGI